MESGASCNIEKFRVPVPGIQDSKKESSESLKVFIRGFDILKY